MSTVELCACEGLEERLDVALRAVEEAASSTGGESPYELRRDADRVDLIGNDSRVLLSVAGDELRCFCFATLAALGSKYLAVGTPSTLGIIELGPAADATIAAHTQLYGPLDVRVAGDNVLRTPYPNLTVEQCCACDIVCTGSETELDEAWFADATHLNCLVGSSWSKGMESLLRQGHVAINSRRLTDKLPNSHGTVRELVTGAVSGRMGPELTGLAQLADECEELTILTALYDAGN